MRPIIYLKTNSKIGRIKIYSFNFRDLQDKQTHTDMRPIITFCIKLMNMKEES